MKLQTTGASLKLSVLGYQYPDAEREGYDANWLLIHIDAAGPHGTWTASDPALLTYEAERLADWLEQVQAGKEQVPALSFLEPVLLFRLVKDVDGGRALRIYFEEFLRPPWAASTGEGSRQDLWLEFPLEDVDLAAAAKDLREQLRRYPRRAEW
jgi:hypothetical protein